MKLTNNQSSVIKEAVKKNGWSAHSECRTMNALAKKGLIICINPQLGFWQVTDLAKQLFN